MEIERWRDLADLTIELDADADFLCLVGVNGVGKSNLLELIAFASSQLASFRNRCRNRPLPFQRSEPFGIAGSLIKRLESTALRAHLAPDAARQMGG